MMAVQPVSVNGFIAMPYHEFMTGAEKFDVYFFRYIEQSIGHVHSG